MALLQDYQNCPDGRCSCFGTPVLCAGAMLCERVLRRRERGCISLMSCLHAQALDVLRRVRGTQNVQLEYDDIMAASKVAAQVATLPTSPHMSSSALLQQKPFKSQSAVK